MGGVDHGCGHCGVANLTYDHVLGELFLLYRQHCTDEDQQPETSTIGCLQFAMF